MKRLTLLTGTLLLVHRLWGVWAPSTALEQGSEFMDMTYLGIVLGFTFITVGLIVLLERV